MHAMHASLWGDYHYLITGKDDAGNLKWAGGFQNEAKGSRLASVTYPSGMVLNYNYGSANGVDDVIGRLSSMSDSVQTLKSYSYLGLGTLVERLQNQTGVKLTYVKQGMELNGDAGDKYAGLDQFGRIVDQRWYSTSGSTDVDRYQYAYDRNSNRTQKVNALSSGFNETYAYDGLNRLISTDRTTGTTNDQSWALDPLGNMTTVTTGGTSETRIHDAQNQLVQMGNTTLNYDLRGNVILDDHGYTLIYDAWNRLLQVKNGDTVLKTFAYDGLGRRITDNDGTTTTDLYYTQQWQLIEERTGSGSGTARRQYVWSAGAGYPDALVLRNRDTDNNDSLDERLYATQDAQFNVTGILNTSATVQERFAYNAYGTKAVLNSSWSGTSDSKGWVVGHQGLFEDVATGWYHNRNRVYSATLGRFGQQEVNGAKYADGLNLYSSYRGGPLSGRDPSGNLTIYMWDASSEGIGHVSIKLCNNRYISWWPDDSEAIDNPKGSPASRNPDRTVEVPCGCLDEGAIEKWWNSFLKVTDQQWNAAYQNCATIAASVLNAGAGALNPCYLSLTHSHLWWSPADVESYAKCLQRWCKCKSGGALSQAAGWIAEEGAEGILHGVIPIVPLGRRVTTIPVQPKEPSPPNRDIIRVSPVPMAPGTI